MTKQEHIVIVLDGMGTAEATKVRYDADDEDAEHEELLDEMFGSSSSTWQSISVEEAIRLRDAIDAALKGEAEELGEVEE